METVQVRKRITMNKSKYFHPFIKWHYLLGQESTDLKEEYSPSDRIKKMVDFYHEELDKKMVEIQKSHIDKISDIIIEMKEAKYFALRRMCSLQLYESIIDFARGKKKSIPETHLLEFRKTSWGKYNEHKVEKL